MNFVRDTLYAGLYIWQWVDPGFLDFSAQTPFGGPLQGKGSYSDYPFGFSHSLDRFPLGPTLINQPLCIWFPVGVPVRYNTGQCTSPTCKASYLD